MVVDGRAHLLGRLASKIAKELLSGVSVTVVRCEQIEVSGSLSKNRVRFLRFLRKSSNTNPRKGGCWHYRAPSMMLKKAVQGMVPRKTPRGAAALERLKVFDGVPHPYDTVKKMVVPEALKVVKFDPTKKTTILGELASIVGWSKKSLVERLEAKRLEKAQTWFARKQQKENLEKQALERLQGGALQPVLKTLQELGH